MKKVCVTFTAPKFQEQTERLVNGCLKSNVETWQYDEEWLKGHPFYEMNKWVFESKRGFGWWCWKPLIVLDAFKRLKDGDIVLYLDTDTYPIRNIDVLFDICDKDGIMVFKSPYWFNYQYNKADCSIAMGQDSFLEEPNGATHFALFKKGDWKSEQILMEWLTYCINPRCNTKTPSILAKEDSRFIDHREDQSILTLLALKHKVPMYMSPYIDSELYQTIFIQK